MGYVVLPLLPAQQQPRSLPKCYMDTSPCKDTEYKSSPDVRAMHLEINQCILAAEAPLSKGTLL